MRKLRKEKLLATLTITIRKKYKISTTEMLRHIN